MEAINMIHRFLGESLVTLAVIGALLALFSVDPKSTITKAAWIAATVFGILLSVQWLLGIINYFMLPAGARPSLAHPIFMTLVVAAYHPAQRRLKKLTVPRFPLLGLWVATAILLSIGLRLV